MCESRIFCSWNRAGQWGSPIAYIFFIAFDIICYCSSDFLIRNCLRIQFDVIIDINCWIFLVCTDILLCCCNNTALYICQRICITHYRRWECRYNRILDATDRNCCIGGICNLGKILNQFLYFCLIFCCLVRIRIIRWCNLVYTICHTCTYHSKYQFSRIGILIYCQFSTSTLVQFHTESQCFIYQCHVGQCCVTGILCS